MGDEVQAIKAGLLEVADLVVVNKGDKPGAQRTAAQLRAMLVAAAPRDAPAGRRPAAPEAPGGADHDRRDRRRRPGAARGARPAPRGRRGRRDRPAPGSPAPRRRSGRSSRTGCARGSTTPSTRPGPSTARRCRGASARPVRRGGPAARGIELLSLPTRTIGRSTGPPSDGRRRTFARRSRSYLVRATQTGSAEDGVAAWPASTASPAVSPSPSAALILIVGASFAHDAPPTGGLPAARYASRLRPRG